jgi:hypothetical protein
MLGMHPAAVFCGEILRLEEAFSQAGQRCSCGAPVPECPVWQRRAARLPERLKTEYSGWTFEALERVRAGEGKALLVDSSKSRVLRLERAWDSSRTGYLLLVRDPRGALRSALEEGGDLEKLLRTSRKWMRRYESFARRHPGTCLTVFYEDLTTSAEGELRRICDFAGLDYIPAMSRPDQESFHLIRASRSKYLRDAGQLKTDERWRAALTPEQVEAINRALGTIPLYRDRYGLSAPPGGASRGRTIGRWVGKLFSKNP